MKCRLQKEDYVLSEDIAVSSCPEGYVHVFEVVHDNYGAQHYSLAKKCVAQETIVVVDGLCPDGYYNKDG